MIDPGQFGRGSSGGDHLAGNPGPKTGRHLRARLEIFADRVADVGQRLVARGTWRQQPGSSSHQTAKPFSDSTSVNRVIHDLSVIHRAGFSSR